MKEQKTLALEFEDISRLEEQRSLIKKFLKPESYKKFETPAGKLGTLRAILESGVFSKEKTYELQSLGVVLGDVFVQDMGFEWIVVQDEYGRNPAIHHPDKSIILFPLTMISKRIERGENPDVFELYNGVANHVEELLNDQEVK